MICELEHKDLNKFKTTNILPQTPFWGHLKKNQGFLPKGFELTISKDLLVSGTNTLEKIGEDILVLIKYIDQNTCFAYVPYGPKLEPTFENQGVFLEQLSESIKPKLPKNCIFIRYDLTWKNQWAVEKDYFDSRGNWIGPPSTKIQEYRVNFNTEHWNLKKSIEDSLPKNTFFLDLTLNEQDLLYNMRYNTRYNVRNANKKGIRVREYGVDCIGDWYKLYVDTATRHNMPVQSQDYFSSILQNQNNSKKGVNIKMLMADIDGEFLSSMFLVLSKQRGTYLYGASTSYKNNLMASYALQWESIKLAKRLGCTEYDMFGSAPNLNRSHPLHGVHIYKKGFGGNLYHRMGCWDYPYNKKVYDLYRLEEMKNMQN
ncbi:peptidoglycan bridge formation glycyltransferase FemA/FemB family protein [Tamlana sp. 2_MG-2023]|uniref:lipid II:glycine glycyltransferase FemX n=1 Tax=unclassified Tamlana TaxID=2614803 RepID=UPI0026E12AF0|nr:MULTISPECIES: peptidoglycan bridge formation glycyltransferase FemA/FemB family protein [unclassified Tamlana]MDO6761817.1 peptidoglycan bridge formation glycyltransferase FemA/FemB family protein [Tamlana sp. 2_MG-2023]MDO6792580.1 peptidoglycan bridge formation glycyltransferase FemA/FemB family protein [Tamlana sp. 1_MG-2023]